MPGSVRIGSEWFGVHHEVGQRYFQQRCFRAANSLGASDCVWLPTSWTTFLQWSGGASLLAGEESERTLRFGLLHALVFCFTRFLKALGWSSCLALSNQQAYVRSCCFTGRSRPLGTGFLTGSRCYLLICSFHH